MSNVWCKNGCKHHVDKRGQRKMAKVIPAAKKDAVIHNHSPIKCGNQKSISVYKTTSSFEVYWLTTAEDYISFYAWQSRTGL